MSDKAFILDAWRFTSGKPEKIESVESFEEGCWYHCHRETDGLPEWLVNIGMQDSLVDLLIDTDTRSNFHLLEDGNFLLILRGVNLNAGDEPDDMISLRIIYYKHSIITLRRKPFEGVSSIQRSLEKHGLPNTISDLIFSLVEKINEQIEKVLDDVESSMDDIEDNIDNLTREQQRTLTLLHRRFLRLSRFLKPQTIAIQAFYENIPQHLRKHKQRLLNQKEASQRINEAIESNLLQISMLRNDIQQSLGERMNRNAYYLSLTAGIFLPLGFFTGLFGINIGGMPGVDNPEAFRWFCIAMGLLGLAGFLMLRRLRFW